MSRTVLLSRDEARRRMVSWLGLARPLGRGAAGVRATLARLRCVQLDPLDAVGTNAELVALARVDGVRRGQVLPALLPGHAFEHFAKERCLVPADRFGAYRARALQAPWWRLGERLQRLPEGLLEEVLAEVRARGPIADDALTQRGRVEPLDWSGWRGTSRAEKMALEVLWTRCEVVVTGRTARSKLYDVPERALPGAPPAPAAPLEVLLLDRVAACGLMCTALGVWWSGLRDQRDDGTLDRLLARGELRRVRVEGGRRDHLARPDFLEHAIAAPDDRVRVLGPLDPLLWDRALVEQLWGFDYVWEVYKPAERRRWGWYVVPLLRAGRLVGRLEAHTEGGRVVVDQLWLEPGQELPRRALDAALTRLHTA